MKGPNFPLLQQSSGAFLFLARNRGGKDQLSTNNNNNNNNNIMAQDNSPTMVELTVEDDDEKTTPTPTQKKTGEIDVSALSPEDQEFYRKYNRLPNKTVKREKQKQSFDSADYFMAAAQATKGPGAGGPKKPRANKMLPPHMR